MSDSLVSLVTKGAKGPDLGAYLDGLEGEARVREVLSFPGRLQAKLYEAVKGNTPLSREDLIPTKDQTVIYELKNSLLMFTVSQKRFFWPSGADRPFGYNHTGGFSAFFAGPGYFFVDPGDNGEIVFDYTQVPDHLPEGWPPIKPNTGLIPGIVYGNMQDYVRRISSNTVIGAAFKGKKPRNMYFMLTRAL